MQDALRRAAVAPALADQVATLTELTARTVADAVAAAELSVVVASGGGVRDPVLMRRLAELLPGVRLTVTDELGVPSDAKEAVAFALIGWATLHGLPGSVPSCTGARDRASSAGSARPVTAPCRSRPGWPPGPPG